MPKVFISGSITLKRLAPQVEARLDNIVASGHEVLVGDAAGVDQCVQQYFANRQYAAVTVYCTGDTPRHNLGAWPLVAVCPPANAKGRAFYTAKDLEMAEAADFGLMIWDGKSPGTLSNVFELLDRARKSVVYRQAAGLFCNVHCLDDLQALIAQMDEPARLEADKKVGLSRRIERLSRKVEDPVAIRQQIDEHLTAIARHQRRVAELQAKLDAISTSTGADLFS